VLTAQGATPAPASPAAPQKRQVTFTYDPGPNAPLRDVQLGGSWSERGEHAQAWTTGIPMQRQADGRWTATVELVDDGQSRPFEWGVSAVGPSGSRSWAVMGEQNLKFSLGQGATAPSYTPTTDHRMGAQRVGEHGIRVSLWAPNAQAVRLEVTDPESSSSRLYEGETFFLQMQRQPDGTWVHEDPQGWAKLEGKSYLYEVTTSDGKTVERKDPYALRTMGEQRGVDRIYFGREKGASEWKEVDFYFDENGAPAGREKLAMMRFEIDDEPRARKAFLVLKDESGRPLTRKEVEERIPKVDASIVKSARQGAFDDFWRKGLQADGRIQLTDVGGAFSTVINHPEALHGLRYELQAYDAKGKLIDDTDGNGVLSVAEAKASGYNDRWSNLLTKGSGVDYRGAVIGQTSYDFKYDAVPREKDPTKWVVYQLHLGSFRGSSQNMNRSTIEDALGQLDYLKDLGVNTLKLLPTNEVEGVRDWGYGGVNNFSVESAYGFEDESGRWVEGPEALKRLIDEAHKRGLNVISDVVYNHVFGDYNDLWELDGPENPYFNWSKDPSKLELRDTKWGAIPAYHQEQVRQYFVDHAVSQVRDFHFDGLRFDAIEPIHGKQGGQQAGLDMLREINRQVRLYNPDVYTVAEQFDYNANVSDAPDKGNPKAGGFDAQWYPELGNVFVAQHDPTKSGLIQSVTRGRGTNFDEFVKTLTTPWELRDWTKALNLISNHDSVGLDGRTVNTAAGGHDKDRSFPPQWARNAARLTAGVGMTMPGTPMFFQGDESLAQNNFDWDVFSKWDVGWEWQNITVPGPRGRQVKERWDWEQLTFDDTVKATYERLFALPADRREQDEAFRRLSPADRQVFRDLAAMPADRRERTMLHITRRQTHRFFKDAIRLRNENPALQGAGKPQVIYQHNDDSVLAYRRWSREGDFVVIASLNQNNLGNYGLGLPLGEWEEVFNSDAAAYGGSNFGNAGGVFGPHASLNLPAGGFIVLKNRNPAPPVERGGT
jgi:maltooligosyltrehalose trehalohydrolase